MEIHAPKHPITGWKQTVKHLAIITAGVLIALALEGIVAWLRSPRARPGSGQVANLTEEIRNNKKALDGMFANLEKEQRQLGHADEVAQVVSDRKVPGKIDLDLSANPAELKNAAVTTGQITGAFGYMKYDQVSRYASVYDLQAQFMRLQERDGQNFQALLAFIPRLDGASPPSPAAVEDWRGHINIARAGIFIREQVARQLQKRYDEMLASEK